MKKNYEAPKAEVVRFEYKDQVVVASGTCIAQRGNVLHSSLSECEEIIGSNNQL